MKTILLFLATITVTTLFFRALLRYFREACDAKRAALQGADFTQNSLADMYAGAQWLTRMIAASTTYQELFTAEDYLDRFAEAYRDCDGISEVLLDLIVLLEKARRVVRYMDRPQPFNPRYSEEEL